MIQGLLPDPTPKRLTHAQIKAWNRFIDEYKPQGNLDQLYQQYMTLTGDSSFSAEDLNNELGLLNQKLTAMAERKHMVSGKATNAGYRFPELQYEDTNLGPVNGEMQTQMKPERGTTYPEKFLAKQIPSEIIELQWSSERQLPFFISPQTGDMTFVDVYWLNHPRFRKTPQQIQKTLETRGMAESLLPRRN